ncbi:MAG: hypothetical protein IH810_05370, partial [Proteobacteria bacterium]|nr:hypothetical protein [Pseudomonadota bacterium]
LADDNEKTYCLVVAVKAAIVNRDTEPVAINLLEVLEKRLESNEQFSDLLAGLPEKGVSHEK